MTSRGFNLPEFPPRLPPFLESYQRQRVQDYPGHAREQAVRNGILAHQKADQARVLLDEIHDLIKGMGTQYASGKGTETARDYSARAISAVGQMALALSDDISKLRAGR